MITIPVNIELGGLVDEFKLTYEQSISLGASIIDSIVDEYSFRWEGLVNSELTKSRSEYKRAMVMERNSPTEVTFGLIERESPLALMIEEGVGPFDEKPGFSRSDKVKIKKEGGWYLTIPFRHATSQAVAESGAFSSIMPREIYKIVKNEGVISKKNLPAEYNILGVRKEIDLPQLKVPEYVHKSSIYEGLVKVNIASTEKEKRSGYFTFRRVSDTSDPNSWWNGGIEAHKLMDKALERAQIDKVVDVIIDNYLQNI